MNTLHKVLCVTFCLVVSGTLAFSASKYAVATGNWGSTSTWSTTRGGTSGASQPAATDTVWIPSPFIVTVDASGKSCYNLIIENGGTLIGTGTNPTNNQVYVRVNGDFVQNDGVIGYDPSTPAVLTPICFESYVATKTVTFKGSGISKISRMRNGNNVSNTTIVIDQDMTLTYTGSSGGGGVCWYGAQGTGTGNTFKVNSGRTVNFLDYGYIGTNSSVDADGPNTTIQVDGSLLMSGTNCTLSLRPLTGATVSLIVNGTVEVGRTLKPTGTTGVASVITVNSGGIFKSGTAGGGVTYFDSPAQTVTGAGTFQFAGGSLQIGAAAGLDPASGPIRTSIRSFSSTARYLYVGTVAQVTGPDLPSSVGGISASDSQGVTLTNNLTVTDTTSIISGGCKLLTGAHTFTNNGRITIPGTFQIDEGGWATGSNDFTYNSTGTLAFNTASNYGVNNDPPRYWPATIPNVTVQNLGGITLNVPRAVTGVFQTSAEVANSFGNDLTVSGIVRMNNGGYFNNFCPTYTSTGTLVYNCTGAYGNYSEWQAGGAAGYGVPQNVTVQNGTTLSLSGDRTVPGTLTIISGHLDLNGYTLTLGPTATLSETAGNTVTGTTGIITTTRTLTAPAGADIAGLGVAITSAVDLGSTVINRGHAIQSSNGNASIARYFEITPTTNTGLNATFVFKYDDSELNSIGEGNLALFKFDGSAWANMGGTRDPLNNTITLTGVDGFSRWTAGDISAPLPIQLASFTGRTVNGGVRLDWTTVSELNNYGFYVQKKRTTETNWGEVAESFTAGHGTTNTPHQYTFTDQSATQGNWQYRLKQVDLGGTVRFTEPILVDVLTDVKEVAPLQFALLQNYPNPFNPSTEIKFSVQTSGHTTLHLYNTLGQHVATLFDGVAEAGQYYQVRLNGTGLASGTYFYHLQSGNNSELKKLVLLK